MSDRSCGECAKLRTPSCKNPDECVQGGYKYFQRSRPWKKCSICGGPMRVKKTEVITDMLVVTSLICADCQAEGDLTNEYIPKTKTPA